MNRGQPVARRPRAAGVRPGLVVVAVVAATVFLAARPAGGQQKADQQQTRLDTWLVAIVQHTPGERDGSTLAVAGWSRDELDSALDLLEKAGVPTSLAPLVALRLSPADAVVPASVTTPPPVDMNRLLERAALLHADIAIVNRDASGYRLPSDGHSVVLANDGKHVGHATGTVHWAFARSLLDAIQPSPSDSAYVRQWYRATAACLQLWREYSELEPHLGHALTLFPNDAVLWLDSGTMHEAYASPEIQRAVATDTKIDVHLPSAGHGFLDAPFSPVLTGQSTLTSAETQRADAETAFRHALQLDPSLVEAKIRLAHVLGERGRHAEAITDLRQAIAAKPPPTLEFYAQVLLARELQTTGKPDDARRAASRAVAISPGAQSAHVLLSELDRDAGDQAAAVADLSLLDRSATEVDRDDPWWGYEQVHVPNARQLVLDLWKTKP